MINLIQNIKSGENIDQIFSFVLNRLFANGPVSTTDMEILSYLAEYQRERFNKYQDTILNRMGLFYKQTSSNTLKDVIFNQYKQYILDRHNFFYTPIQAKIIKGLKEHQCFSFSAPTSTGKSFVFINEIKRCENDVVVVVPSRALINEYYLKLNEQIQDKSINILTFIDKINTRHARRNIFIVTPERCRELFKRKKEFDVDLFLFDEAQLSNEESARGLYFDSIVRRCYKSYPNAKFVFAHPFVSNPQSQIIKNHFDINSSSSFCFKQKNVGQMFLCHDNGRFYHFGIDTNIMGKLKIACEFDPIARIIADNGSVLFYISKSKIYKKEFLTQFHEYIELCNPIEDPRVDDYIERLKSYTGGNTITNRTHYSQLLTLLKRGIVIHHGSLPLQTRIIIEQYTRDGFCRLCFATSTLEQGINLPFDLVYLDRLEGSKPLSVKNLIGRAGRTSVESKFDYGYVVINSLGKRQNFRQIITGEETLEEVSLLENNDVINDDYSEFKESILNDTYSDEFNLTNNDLDKLTNENMDVIVQNILNSIFYNDNLVSLDTIRSDERCRLNLYTHFSQLYSAFLGRQLEDGENDVLNTAIKIILWRIHGKTFKNICWYRYSYAINSKRMRYLKKNGQSIRSVKANFITAYKDIPDKNLRTYSMYEKGTLSVNVDYDRIVYDTYDYIDKLIGFKLSDIFYAAFYKYYEKTNDVKSLRLAKYIKFGTDNEKEIWLLRYGLSFEDIELLGEYIINVNSEEMIVSDKITELTNEQLSPVLRYIL